MVHDWIILSDTNNIIPSDLWTNNLIIDFIPLLLILFLICLFLLVLLLTLLILINTMNLTINFLILFLLCITLYLELLNINLVYVGLWNYCALIWFLFHYFKCVFCLLNLYLLFNNLRTFWNLNVSCKFLFFLFFLIHLFIFIIRRYRNHLIWLHYKFFCNFLRFYNIFYNSGSSKISWNLNIFFNLFIWFPNKCRIFKIIDFINL